LAAGLHPDPLGELKRLPYPLAAIGGSKGEGTREERGRIGRENKREGLG